MIALVTTSTRNPSPILRTYFPERFKTAPSIQLSSMSVFSSSRAAVAVKCSENGSLKDMLSGIVDEKVEELLNKEENRGLLEGLEEASRRVEMAKRDLADIQNQEIEAQIMRDYINQFELRASQIAESQKEISEARAMLEEAELSLTDDPGRDVESESINKEEERLQSVKAASISAVIGTLVELPISLTRVTSNSQMILPLAITFLSCALFGVTFRYTIRRDLDNFQLKSGTSAAFGIVKGLGVLGAGLPLELDAGSILPHAFDGAVYVSESLLIFLFAGVALDLCIKLRILSPFPIHISIPRR